LAPTNNSRTASLRRWIWPALAVVVLVLIYSHFHDSPLRVHATTVQRAPIRSLVSTNGKIEPVQNFNFEAHAPISTTVKRLLIKEGDRVRKGELLLQLDDDDIRTQAARAEEQVKSAQASEASLEHGGTQEELIDLNAQIAKDQTTRDMDQRTIDTLRRLQQQGAASIGEVHQAEDALRSVQAELTSLEQKKRDRYSQPEVAKIRAQASEAQAAYDAAEDALRKSSVRAPFDGIVYSLPVKQGAFVQSGDLLLQEADLSRVLVRAFVDEPDIGRLQLGQKVEVTWDALPGRTWTGTVSTLPSTIKVHLNRNVGEATCTIENPDLRLLPNINVGISIVVAQDDNVLTLERDALHSDDTQPYVYRIVNDQLQRKPITISLQNLTRVEITSGLDEGAQVALSAEDGKPLFDGAFVKVIP
jgi:HlyD family secretion protein